MLEIRQLKLKVTDNEKLLDRIVERSLDLRNIKTNKSKNYTYKILRKSLDARKKPDLYYIYTVGVELSNSIVESAVIDRNKKKKPKDRYDIVTSDNTEYHFAIDNNVARNIIDSPNFVRPVIVGFGPAGMFCAYILAMKGFKPIIFERGEKVDQRQESINKYLVSRILNPESNVQFGEGGAGTFSDGKLNTLTKDKFGRQEFVLDTFVRHGAPVNITYDAKPHIGTDVLSKVIKNIREEIISLGGTFYFETKVQSISVTNNIVNGVYVKIQSENSNVCETVNNELIPCNHVVLAIGHSARDTFEMLKDNKINMEQKSFAVGFRVEHPQEMINVSQYGPNYPKSLGAAAYKLAYTASNGRRVYSFCMCPGGHVIDAASETEHICVNGMSYSKRDSDYANSAIIVGIDPEDFIVDDNISPRDPLRGMYYQRRLEKKAFEIGHGNVPAMKFVDFEASNNCTEQKEDLTQILTDEMNEAFIEAMHRFGKQIEGFDSSAAMMYGVEARTSSPVKILRNDKYESNIKGIYPCGEGAGYAGGIMSAAVDGIKVAEAVISEYIQTFSIK